MLMCSCIIFASFASMVLIIVQELLLLTLFFISWVVQIHDVWEVNDKDESLISIHHEVAQYIRGDRILANTPWVNVDHVCIPVNSSAAFHWFLVVFSIRKRCLYIYDSLNGYGVKHTNAVTSLVQKISRMIPLFLVATDYYALRKDIDWNTDVHYAGRPVGDPLVYGNHENIPQQCDNSTIVVCIPVLLLNMCAVEIETYLCRV
ncbi:hypothetical protein AABB24_013990 [Solanum stoloniferum]|uniref:Ubiquitin-like protease family profile domain-containing protein n=1 Tax=Solanum stoloniferum TaxID=62892 RepID=A0ABD2TXH4_9SOLN